MADESAAPEQRGARWWIFGMFREGLGHLALATAQWLALYWFTGVVLPDEHKAAAPIVASLMVPMFWIGRELRDWEIEVGPRIWRALGFKSAYPLAPAKRWTLEQFRHSLSGWFPVTVLNVGIILWHVLR